MERAQGKASLNPSGVVLEGIRVSDSRFGGNNTYRLPKKRYLDSIHVFEGHSALVSFTVSLFCLLWLSDLLSEPDNTKFY
jgi:hypothetical protein